MVDLQSDLYRYGHLEDRYVRPVVGHIYVDLAVPLLLFEVRSSGNLVKILIYRILDQNARSQKASHLDVFLEGRFLRSTTFSERLKSVIFDVFILVFF